MPSKSSLLWKILALVALFVLAVGATLAVLAWLDRARDAGDDREPREVSWPTAAGSSSEIRIGEPDLNHLLLRSLEESPNGQRVVELAKDVRASISDGRIEVGAVINFSEIPPEKLSEDERQAVDKITGVVPFLADRDLYLGLNGVPAVVDGKLTVERDLKVKLAFVTLPAEEIGELLGLSPEALRRDFAIDLSPFTARKVVVLEDELVIYVGTG